MSTAPATSQGEQVGLPGFVRGLDLLVHLSGRVRQLRRPPVQAALWQQVQRGALDYVWLAAAIGALAGFFTIATIGTGFGLGVAVAVSVMQALILGQFAGFACALLLVAGPGTAAAFEIGLMRQRGELRTLQLIGISPRDYLVLPRVLGFACALFVLTFVFQLAAVLGGFAIAAFVTDISFTQQFVALASALKPSDLMVSGFRSLLVGGAIGLLVCDHGMEENFSPAQVPRISRHLLSRSLVVIVFMHGVTALFLP